MSERCRKVDGVMIPGCIARSNDERACTCAQRSGSNLDLSARVKDLEAKIVHLGRRIVKLECEIRRKRDDG